LRSSGTRRIHAAALIDAKPPDSAAVEGDGFGAVAQPLAGERGKQLALAVACHAGDADDLAGPHAKAHRVQADAVGVGGRKAELFDRKPNRSGLMGGRRADRGDLGADHQTRQSGHALLARIAACDHLAGAQHGGAVAQAAHFLQPMGDIEQRATVPGQLLQRDKQRLGLLRRSTPRSAHRGSGAWARAAARGRSR
jgi:hypothetical protein